MKRYIAVLVLILVTFILTLVLSLIIILQENELKKLKKQFEMYSLYYELKLDYYEERYGVDLDAVPEDFEKFLYENYSELYDYLVEQGE